MDVFYEAAYQVDSREFDLFGHCRPSAVLGLLQEAATQAGAAIGLSREAMLERYHAFWMLSRIRYTLNRPLLWNEAVTIKTWHRGSRAAVMYRDFDLFVGGEPVGQAISAWVLAGLEDHKLLHLSTLTEVENTDGGSLCRTDLLRKLRLPGDLTAAGERRMGYSDTDINAHVNNTRYADFMCDALCLEKAGAGKFVSRLQLSYLAECLAGETIELFTGREGETFFLQGRGREGEARFDGSLTLDNLPQED